MTIKNIGIVGYGSIGQKHHQILASLSDEFEFSILTQQKGVLNSFSTLESFSTVDLDYIIISNATSLHYESLKFLDERYKKIKFLIEKPLFHNVQSFDGQSNLYFVGYNLRFNQIIDEFIKLIRGKSIISIAMKTYSYLPQWRKNINYQSSSSASKSKGGGVLRDLSHEVDLVNFLFGAPKFLYADSRKISHLDIETDDYLLACGQLDCGAPFNIELNYFSRFNSREIFVETSQESIKLDLANCNLIVIGDKKSFVEHDIDINSSYKAMHQAIMSDNFENVCSLQEAMLVLQQIEQIEHLSSS